MARAPTAAVRLGARRRHKLTHNGAGPARAFGELDGIDNGVLLQHSAAVRADGFAAGIIDVDLRASARALHAERCLF